MRGQRKLFEEFIPEIETEAPLKKGRSALLQEKRDTLLVSRFFFYSTTTKTRFDEILNILEAEFFLSKTRISDVLDEQYQLLKKLHKDKPAVSYFKKEWPHLVW